MTVVSPYFSPSEFELRNFTNQYLSPEQSDKVALTETRVSGQLDFLGQLLGWSGDNYWKNLPATQSQKRQLLGGTLGVYNSFVLPRVLTVRSWENIEDFLSPLVGIIEIEEDDRIQAGQIAYLGLYSYPILSLTKSEGKLTLNFGEVDSNFFSELNNNTQLKIDVPSARPTPFQRTTVGVAGDNSFVCRDNEGQLSLYPSYDTNGLFPYLFPIFFAGSTYYFDKPLYVSYSNSLTVDIAPFYDETIQRWVLHLPASLGEDSAGIIIFLVWSYSDDTTPTDSVLQVKVQNWVNPSDWNSVAVLQNFLGAWGNKGGALPFNLAFDSLSLHGFSENNSIYFPQIERELLFNDVVDLVYSQRSLVDSGNPGLVPPGKLWWNTEYGTLAVQIEQDESCPFWVQVVYREAPEQELIPEILFPDVTAFLLGQNLVPVGTISIAIADITGLSSDDNVIGLPEPLPGPGRVYLYNQPDTEYWVPVRFVFNNVSDFDAASAILPYDVPVYILDSTGLGPAGTNYTINNLKTTVTGKYEVVLVKEDNISDWTLFPDSILKFIANSSLFDGPLRGEMWWDFANPDPNSRSASIYLDTSWVALNTNVALSSPPDSLDMGVILFYCDGNLLTDGFGYLTDDYEFTYSSNPSDGTYTFTYRALTFAGKTQFPTILISDSLTSSYRLDISDRVFSGIVYNMSPNVYDAEVPLRLWKSQHLQASDTSELIERGTYPNPLVADLNTGPCLENWQRYFVRLPLDYGRNGATWQKVALICQDFAYYGSSIEPEKMDCPPNQSLPKIYEEISISGDRTDYTYVYSEPYLYSVVAYNDFSYTDVSYSNAAVKPVNSTEKNGFQQAELIDYDPLHNRLVDFSSEGFGNWEGVYLNVSACSVLSGYYVNDVMDGAVEVISPPIWDASIYKCPPTCDNPSKTYDVDANNYKICYAYFVADASAAEDGFFNPQEEAAWRQPIKRETSLYVLPPSG